MAKQQEEEIPKQVVVIDIKRGIYRVVIDQISSHKPPQQNLRLKRTIFRGIKLVHTIAFALGYCAEVQEKHNTVVSMEFSSRLKKHFAETWVPFEEGAQASEKFFYLQPEDADEQSDSDTDLVH